MSTAEYREFLERKVAVAPSSGFSVPADAINPILKPHQRAIVQYSMPGETVLDPFAGLGTVVERAVRLKRKGIGIELNPRYWRDSADYCEAADRELSMPTLFDVLDQSEDET